MWFKKLVDFEEETPDQVRAGIEIDGEYLISKKNGQRYRHGRLEIPTLEELILSAPNLVDYSDSLMIYESVGDIQDFHVGYEGAMFQAASQFNLLEMVHPEITPEMGVDRYEQDFTQGPACAIACGAGTIYRNYFVNWKGKVGQTKEHQVDCLEEIGNYLNHEKWGLWKMTNGYAMLTAAGLAKINEQMANLKAAEYLALKNQLRIGLQLDTEVTIKHGGHIVSQAYCSGLPIGYSHIPVGQWGNFAKMVLDATYEATFYAALKNYEMTGNRRLFLTLVGGGVFRNPQQWIFEAIRKSVLKFRKTPLQVYVVSYGSSNPALKSFLGNLSKEI